MGDRADCLSGSACRARGRSSWENANVALSECLQLLPFLSPSLGTRAGSGSPRMPQAFSGPAESIVSATIIIRRLPPAFLFPKCFDVHLVIVALQ
jgi:hypothetical protein